MAGYGTMKPGGHEAVQLTFPAVFSETYAKDRLPLSYRTQSRMPFVEPVAGTDFQAKYHEQKKADADRMAHAKVVATRNMKTRAFSSHQGYFGMPAPSLAQRKYANPSGGQYSSHSARQDGTNAPFQLVESGSGGGALSGGVLRSAEGQAFGKSRLMDRVRQLNNIEAAKQVFKGLAPEGSAPEGDSLEQFQEMKPIGTDESIELQTLLKGILNSTMVGDYEKLSSTAFLGEGMRVLKLLFRWSIGADADDFIDKIALVENITKNIIDLTDDDRIAQVVGEADDSGERYGAVLTSVGTLFGKILQYLRGMNQFISTGTRTVEDKKLKSAALVKQLKFDAGFDPMSVGVTTSTSTLMRDTAEDFDEGDDDGRFDRPALTREDEEARSRYVDDFTPDERQSFGYNSGAFYPSGGRDRAMFFGEPEQEVANVFTRGAPEVEQAPAPPPSITSSEARRIPPPAPRSEGSLRRVTGSVTGVPDVEVAAEEPASERLTRSDIPNTREGLDALAKRINSMGGIRPDGTIGPGGKNIQVYAAGKVANIRKNFIRRLKL